MLLFMLGLCVSVVFLLGYALNLIDRTNRKKSVFLRFVKILGGLWCVILIVMAFDVWDHRDSKSIRNALEMTRLPPLPPSAKVLKIDTMDNPFSINIWVTFQAPMSEIKTWLGQAQQLKKEPNFNEDSTGRSNLMYRVPQDENGYCGEVEVDESTGIVKITASR